MKVKKENKQLQVIGRSDKVDIPELHIHGMPAKVDTGAYTSSIHCQDIKVVYDKEGKENISFVINGHVNGRRIKKRYTYSNFLTKLVKSSNGMAEERFVIKAHIILFGKSIATEFSLTDRALMRFDILLGRKLLKKRFMVDVNKKDLSFKQKSGLASKEVK